MWDSDGDRRAGCSSLAYERRQGRRKRYMAGMAAAITIQNLVWRRHTKLPINSRAANFFISLSPINTQMNVQTRKKMFQIVKSTTTNLPKLLYLFQ